MNSILSIFAPLALEVAVMARTVFSAQSCQQYVANHVKQLPFLKSLEFKAAKSNCTVFALQGRTLIVAFAGDAKTTADTRQCEKQIIYALGTVNYIRDVVYFAAALEPAQTAMTQLTSLLAEAFANKYRVIFTGHGVGGTIAAIVAVLAFAAFPDAQIWSPLERMTDTDDENEKGKTLPPREFMCFTFGSPVPGTRRLASAIESMGIRRLFYHFCNTGDPTTGAYGVVADSWLTRVMGHVMGGTAVRATFGAVVKYGKINPDCRSPCFGTYVTLSAGGDGETFFRVDRDRLQAFAMLQDRGRDDTAEGDIARYRTRVLALRQRALDFVWQPAHNSKEVRLPEEDRNCCDIQYQFFKNATGEINVLVAYNLLERCVFAVNYTTEPFRVCFTVNPDDFISATKINTRVTVLKDRDVHVERTIPPQTQAALVLVPWHAIDQPFGCESEIINDEALRKVDRNVMPCVTRIATISTAGTGKAFVCLSLNALPDNGVRVLTLRHTFALDQIFLLKLPKDKFTKLRFTLENCTATRSEASTDAKTKVFVTVPAGLDGYAVLGEYSAQDIESSDWDFVAVKAASSVRTAR